MDPLVFSFISSLVIVSIIYLIVRHFRKSSPKELKTFMNIGTQTEKEQPTYSDIGTSTSVKQATKKFQVKPQVFNAATETEEIILDTEELYADLTLFGELLQYNVGTYFQTLKETYNLAVHNFTKKTNFVFQQQQQLIERLEDNITEEVRSRTRFLLECFGHKAYQRFLKDRFAADEHRKLKEADEPMPQQFADYGESEDESLKDIAV